MIESTSTSTEATRETAAQLAGFCSPGDVILLTGELGAGKTAFVQGFTAGMDCDAPVTSPTFVLVQHYEGRLPIVHADLYRMGSVNEVADLGLGELGEDSVTLIEWGDAARILYGEDCLEISIEVVGDTERRISMIPHGERWSARLNDIQGKMS